MTISSLDDLAKQTDTKYSVVKGSDTETYFKHMAKIEETFYNNWKTMSLGSTSPNTADKSSQYAVWDYPLGDKFTIIWNRMKETGLLNSSAEGVQKVSNFSLVVSAFKKRIGGHESFLQGHWCPWFGFRWHLLWVSKPERAASLHLLEAYVLHIPWEWPLVLHLVTS